MKALEIMQEIIREKMICKAKFGRELGLTRQAITKRLSMQNIGVDKLNEMLDMLGYKMVIVPKEAEVDGRGYVVD